MVWTSGEAIVASRLVDLADQNQASGFVGLDGLKTISNNVHRMRTSIIGGFGNNYTVVSGIWIDQNYPLQTDWDDILRPTVGYNTLKATGYDLAEIKWPNITLNAGSYTIKIAVITGSTSGILELLHGETSIGTYDTYSTSYFGYNIVITFTYEPTSRVTADFRLRVNGKNPSSISYVLYITRIEIFKTG